MKEFRMRGVAAGVAGLGCLAVCMSALLVMGKPALAGLHRGNAPSPSAHGSTTSQTIGAPANRSPSERATSPSIAGASSRTAVLETDKSQHADDGSTTVETVTPSGGPSDGRAFDHPDISADGRYVVFASFARNLTPTPPDCPEKPSCESIYVRDRLTRTTTVIASMRSPYPPSDTIHMAPSLSADGRYVAFSAYPAMESVPGSPGMYGGPADAEPLASNAYVYDRVTRRTELVSRNSAGEAARRDPVVNAGPLQGSFASSISADGRYVVFVSDGSNLGGPVEMGKTQSVYVRDRRTGTTTLVSTDEAGQPMHANSHACTSRSISGDGRYVAFVSTAGTGSDSATAGPWGHEGNRYLVHLWDARTGRTRLISKLPTGAVPQTIDTYCATVSLDGSHVAFSSLDALVPDDTNGAPDVYEYDVATGRLQRVSVTSAGKQSTEPADSGGDCACPPDRTATLSADGRYSVFDSAAPDLAPAGGTSSPPSGPRQVFRHDLVTGSTVLVSVSSIGEPLPAESSVPYISANGGAVAFMNSGGAAPLDVMVHEFR